MGDRLVRLGTRASRLARTQTESVAAALAAAHPDLRIELVPISTSGDRTQHTNAPSGDWGSGVFVKELESALLNGEIDLAVHSLKDVPPWVPEGLELVAILAREDPRDVLVTADGRAIEDLPANARVGTSSARRSAFLRAARPDLVFLPIRGNVDTRIRKLQAGDYDAIVLARAGLARLELEVACVVLDPLLLPPAPGQGALAVEGRADDDELRARVASLNHALTGAAVRAERRLMANLEGGCRLPVGALALPEADGELLLLGGVARPDGERAIVDQARGRINAPDDLADELSERLRAAGADDLIPLLHR